MAMEIAEVIVWCDTVECGYRIARLTDGRYAYRWGNIACRVGDVLPESAVTDATDEEGVQVFGTLGEAEQAARDTATALAQSGRPGAADLFAALGPTGDEPEPKLGFRSRDVYREKDVLGRRISGTGKGNIYS